MLFSGSPRAHDPNFLLSGRIEKARLRCLAKPLGATRRQYPPQNFAGNKNPAGALSDGFADADRRSILPTGAHNLTNSGIVVRAKDRNNTLFRMARAAVTASGQEPPGQLPRTSSLARMNC
jgi:hypothetical protein